MRSDTKSSGNLHQIRTATNLLDVFLKRKGLRSTPKRRLVLSQALAGSPHFQADELYLRMRQQGVRISRATVFRTLRLLVESGLLREVLDGEKHSHYEGMISGRHHGHMVCSDCGRVIEFETDSLEAVERSVCRREGFVPETYRTYIVGRCKDCASKTRQGVSSAVRP